MAVDDYIDFRIRGNTIVSPLAPNQAGSAGVGGGSADLLDQGMPSNRANCLWNIQGGIVSNTRLNGPSGFDVGGDALSKIGNNFQDGEVWADPNPGQDMGAAMRINPATLTGICGFYSGSGTTGELYLWKRYASGATFTKQTVTTNVVAGQYRIRLRIVNIDANNISALVGLYPKTSTPAVPGVPIWQIVENLDVTTHPEVAGAGSYGLDYFGGGYGLQLWAKPAGAALAAGEASALLVGRREVRFTWTAASGGTNPKVYSLYGNGVLLQANIGGTGTYTIAGLTPDTDYNLVIRATDNVGATVDYPNLFVRTLKANAFVVGIIGDSELATFGSVPDYLKAPQLFANQVLAAGRQVLIVNKAIPGFTAQDIANAIGTITPDFVTFGCDQIIVNPGVNDSKTAIAHTNVQYNGYLNTIETALLALAPAPRVLYASTTQIAGAGQWDATSRVLLTQYLAVMQARCVSSRVQMIDSNFLALSDANLALYGLIGPEVHYNGIGHQAQANLWFAGFASITQIGSGTVINDPSFELTIPLDYYDSPAGTVDRDVVCVLKNTGNMTGTPAITITGTSIPASNAQLTKIGDWSLPVSGASKQVTLRISADTTVRSECKISFTVGLNGFNLSKAVTIYNATADGLSPFQALGAGVGRTVTLNVRDRAWVCLAADADDGARVYNRGDGPIVLQVAPYSPATYAVPDFTTGEELLPGETKVFTNLELGGAALLFAIGSREILPPATWTPGTNTSTVAVTRGA